MAAVATERRRYTVRDAANGGAALVQTVANSMPRNSPSPFQSEVMA
jgi:hypothetical protein